MAPTIITHVIFDMLGTLVNTNDCILDAFKQYAQHFYINLPDNYMKNILEADGANKMFDDFFDYIKLPEPAMNRRSEKIKLTKAIVGHNHQLMPGVKRFVEHLYSNNIHMAIATSRDSKMFDYLSKQVNGFLDAGKLFEHVVCGATDPEVVNNKPAPDIYHVCCQRFSEPPDSMQNVLIVEDSRKGITGALMTGSKTLLINNGLYEYFDDISDKITLISDSYLSVRLDVLGIPNYD
ncbi:pseudouridine-5'-phosphatase-like [Oppia nitens]|uniref:pseudouridine-5'-phosphatase-like n=1 Tax=Oppia nitens TaxID=1686743 RepID=UPI0023DB1C97|nr:pseudouridine-5'-phosphatase-like [Oppia nitens]